MNPKTRFRNLMTQHFPDAVVRVLSDSLAEVTLDGETNLWRYRFRDTNYPLTDVTLRWTHPDESTDVESLLESNDVRYYLYADYDGEWV